MREWIKGLTDVVKKCLCEKNTTISLQEIYECIKNDETLEISQEQNEITYYQPNWHHSVRRILAELVRNNEVKRVRRGVYEWNKN